MSLVWLGHALLSQCFASQNSPTRVFLFPFFSHSIFLPTRGEGTAALNFVRREKKREINLYAQTLQCAGRKLPQLTFAGTYLYFKEKNPSGNARVARKTIIFLARPPLRGIDNSGGSSLAKNFLFGTDRQKQKRFFELLLKCCSFHMGVGARPPIWSFRKMRYRERAFLRCLLISLIFSISISKGSFSLPVSDSRSR